MVEIHKFLDMFDMQQSNVGETNKPREKGIWTKDMSKMNAVQAFFVRLFAGTFLTSYDKIEVGGKEYVIGLKSAEMFLKDNVTGFDPHGDKEKIVEGVKKFYNDKVHDRGVALSESAKAGDKITVSAADLKLVLKAVGLRDDEVLGALNLKRPKTAEGKGEMNKAAPLNLDKSKFIEVLTAHRGKIEKSTEFPLVKKFVLDILDGRSPLPEPFVEEPPTAEAKTLIDGFKFVQEKVEDRLKQLANLKDDDAIAVVQAAKESKGNAQALLNKMTGKQGKDQDAFLKSGLGITKELKKDAPEAYKLLNELLVTAGHKKLP